jgi:hypothetical protein
MRQRFTPRPVGVDGEPFEDVETAWFWFMRCRIAQSDGARFRANQAETPRPCEPADIQKLVARMARLGLIDGEELRVLAHYGLKLIPPDTRVPEEAADARRWDTALLALVGPLKSKGIVR